MVQFNMKEIHFKLLLVYAHKINIHIILILKNAMNAQKTLNVPERIKFI